MVAAAGDPDTGDGRDSPGSLFGDGGSALRLYPFLI